MPSHGSNARCIINYHIISYHTTITQYHTTIPWDNSKRLGLDKIVDTVSLELLLPLLVLETSPVARIIAYEIPKKKKIHMEVVYRSM